MSFWYQSNTRYQLAFCKVYSCKQWKNIGQTYCKLRESSNSPQLYTVQLYATWFILNWLCQLAITHSILTSCKLYNFHDFPQLFVIIFLTFPQQQVTAPVTLQPSVIGAELSPTTGASIHPLPSKTQLQRGEQLVQRDAAIVASTNMTQDAHLKTVCKTRSSSNQKPHAMGCESILINVNDCHPTILCTDGEYRELCYQFIAVDNGKRSWSMKAVVHTVRRIENHDDLCRGNLTNKCCDRRLRQCTNQEAKNLDKANESYMDEVLAESHFRSSNKFPVPFQHVTLNGKTWRSGTAWTIQHASCIEYGQNGERRVFVRHIRGHTITNEETTRRFRRTDEVGCSGSRA